MMLDLKHRNAIASTIRNHIKMAIVKERRTKSENPYPDALIRANAEMDGAKAMAMAICTVTGLDCLTLFKEAQHLADIEK